MAEPDENRAQPEAMGDGTGGGGETAGAADELTSLREALARAEATAAENWDRYLRTVAELDNLRKRAARDVEQARRVGIERLAAELIPALDSLELGIGQGTSAPESMLDGMQATLRLLLNGFERLGIEVVDPAGQPFDPQYHEAMSMQVVPGAEPGSVVAVMQKGYRLNDRLLRPARVVVAGEAPADQGQS